MSQSKAPLYRRPLFWIIIAVVAVLTIVLPRLASTAPVSNPELNPSAATSQPTEVNPAVECLPVSELGITMLRNEGDPTRGERGRIVSGYTTPVDGEVFDHLAILKLDDGVTFFMAAAGDLSSEDPYAMLYPANPQAEPLWFSEDSDPMDWSATGPSESLKLVEIYGEELAACNS